MYLGIDIGTSAVKVVLMRGDGVLIAQADAALTVQSPQPGWSEQNPDDWWRAVQDACAKLRAADGKSYKEVRAIGLSGQMHGAVCLDAKRRVIRPAILWNDARSAAEAAAMADADSEAGDIAGAMPMPGFTAPKILWLKQNEAENYARIKSILLPKDYVRLRLGDALATDVSDAAGTLWLDQAAREWSPRLCALSAVNREWLPRCVEGDTVTSHLHTAAAEALGLRRGIAIVGGGGDAAAGAAGVGAVNDGDAFVSLGTSGQILTVTNRYTPCSQNSLHSFAHCLPRRWYVMAALLNGASPLAWHAKVMRAQVADLLREMTAAKDAAAVAEAPLFLPYLSGERTPHNDARIRGGFYGLTPATTRADLTRAVVDGIGYGFCDAYAALRDAGIALAAPLVIGGGARGDALVQTLADATGVTLRRRAGVEVGPAIGAARLAAIADGAMTVADLAGWHADAAVEVFAPDAATGEYHARRLERFREWYGRVKSL